MYNSAVFFSWKANSLALTCFFFKFRYYNLSLSYEFKKKSIFSMSLFIVNYLIKKWRKLHISNFYRKLEIPSYMYEFFQIFLDAFFYFFKPLGRFDTTDVTVKGLSLCKTLKKPTNLVLRKEKKIPDYLFLAFPCDWFLKIFIPLRSVRNSHWYLAGKLFLNSNLPEVLNVHVNEN